MLAPFTTKCAMSVDNGINDGLVGRCSMTFQYSFNKDSMMGMANDDNEAT